MREGENAALYPHNLCVRGHVYLSLKLVWDQQKRHQSFPRPLQLAFQFVDRKCGGGPQCGWASPECPGGSRKHRQESRGHCLEMCNQLWAGPVNTSSHCHTHTAHYSSEGVSTVRLDKKQAQTLPLMVSGPDDVKSIYFLLQLAYYFVPFSHHSHLSSFVVYTVCSKLLKRHPY